MTEIYIDADACPVKPEVYKVAKRSGVGIRRCDRCGVRDDRWR